MTELTQNYIRSIFDYKDGNLYWKKPTCNKSRIKIGDKAGSLSSRGYYKISIINKFYYNHRLIFLYHKGYLPKYLDHIDRDKANNKIENLREITNSQNSMNCKSYKNTTSKYKGVAWFNRDKKWRSYITINGNRKHLGLFTNETDAALVYNTKAIELFGEYANLNIIYASKPL